MAPVIKCLPFVEPTYATCMVGSYASLFVCCQSVVQTGPNVNFQFLGPKGYFIRDSEVEGSGIPLIPSEYQMEQPL